MFVAQFMLSYLDSSMWGTNMFQGQKPQLPEIPSKVEKEVGW
jgi:hypothetical protein